MVIKLRNIYEKRHDLFKNLRYFMKLYFIIIKMHDF